MQVDYQQCWSFAVRGAPYYAPKRSSKASLLRRTLRRVGGQTIVLAFVLLDIGVLALAIVAPIGLAPWAAMNVTVLVLGSLSWSEDRRIQRESTTAMQRQGIKVRAAEWRNLQELKRKVQLQLREAEQRQRQEKEEREAQERLQAALRQAKEQLREAEQRQYQEEWRRRQERERAERLREAEQQRREAEQRGRQAEEEREAQRKRRRKQKSAATQPDWWIVLGVAPSASKEEIVRKYRHKIKQCHPDRVVGLAPQLLHIAEEQTKALNGAYENAIRARGSAGSDAVAA